jgi:hypothetical protein
MSSNTININNGQQLQVNTNLAKLFIGKKEIVMYQFTNGGGAPVDIAAGSVLGVVSANGKVKVVDSTAVDGSQLAFGVLAEDYNVAAGATINVAVAISGSEVRRDLLIFGGTDTISTVVSSRRHFEWLILAGILHFPADGATGYDNTIS